MTDAVIPLEKPKEREPVCSFCRRPYSAVKNLVQSRINSHCICDACLKQAALRLKETT